MLGVTGYHVMILFMQILHELSPAMDSVSAMEELAIATGYYDVKWYVTRIMKKDSHKFPPDQSTFPIILSVSYTLEFDIRFRETTDLMINHVKDISALEFNEKFEWRSLGTFPL